MRRVAAGAAVAAGLLAVVAALAGEPPAAGLPPPAAAGDAAKLPAGAGRDATIRVCSGCHTPAIVTAHRLTPAGWGAMVEQMAGNGAQGTDADFAAITAYLATNFPATAPSQP